MNNMYNYVLHFNPYTELWSAVPRDLYQEFWNNPDVKGVLKSKDINTLISLINKGEEFIKKVK